MSGAELSPSSSKRADRPALAISVMIVAVAMLVAMNTAVKLIGTEYHVFQVAFLRNLVAMFVLMPLVLRDGGVKALKTRRPALQLARSITGLLGVCCFYYAVQRLPVADVMVISQAVPLFVTALAVPLLKEMVGWRRWVAVSVGFAGVVLALGPVDQVGGAALAALAGTVHWSLTFLSIRSLSATDNPSATTFSYMVFGTIAAGLVQPWFWTPLTHDVLMLAIAAGFLGAIGQFLIAYAMRFGEASVVTPFNYSAILWAVMIDLAIWGIAPSWWTLGGAAIITAAGLYIFRRETVLAPVR